MSMLLNAIEKAMMNNPLRAAVQRHFEAQRLLAMGGDVRAGRALEIGCGRGIGTELVLDVFGAAHVDAFDLDADMIARAKKRLAPRADRVKLWVGDATAIDSPGQRYDAVFDFAIVHHVPNWRDALGEVHRVLRPGGRFFAEEILHAFIHHPIWSRLLDHPMHDRFDAKTFRVALESIGFRIVAERAFFDQAAWWVAEKPRAA